MPINRREFLKLAGLAGLTGLGGKAAFDLLLPGQAEASLKNLPLTEGRKWGMVIDMTRMNDKIMEACIKACHTIHNVPQWVDKDDPEWEKKPEARWEIKWIWEETYEHSFPEQENEYAPAKYHHHNFLLLCNHCTNPPCCRACPTKATFKRKLDGIVMMDYHRCIGCRFCMAACPYGARSFNWADPRTVMNSKNLEEYEKFRKLNPDFPTDKDFPTRTKGVVEKCNFCAERLAKGQYPACVEAASEIEANAMIFGDLDDPKSEIRKALNEHYTIRRKPELGTGPNLYYII